MGFNLGFQGLTLVPLVGFTKTIPSMFFLVHYSF